MDKELIPECCKHKKRSEKEYKDLIHRYIAWYGGGDCETDYCVINRNRMDYFLRYWATAKAPFYKMFGEKFILRREISFTKNTDDLEEEMDDMPAQAQTQAPVQIEPSTVRSATSSIRYVMYTPIAIIPQISPCDTEPGMALSNCSNISIKLL